MSKYFGKCFGPSTRASKFLTKMPLLFVTKICFTIKVNSVCGAGRDTKNLCHKFNSQGPALRILGLKVAIPKSHGPIFRVLGVRVPCPRVSESQVLGPESQGLRVPALRARGLRSHGPWPWVSGPDARLYLKRVLVRFL